MKKSMKKGQRQIILSVGIAVLFVLFVGYAIQAVYPNPEYSDFCKDSKFDKVVENEIQCENIGGKWKEYDKGIRALEPVKENQTVGWCDRDFYCRENYENARESYSRNIFFISLFIGLVVFTTAIYLKVEAVSVGFMGGAILLIIYGTIRNWGNLSDAWRTTMLGFALGCLVYIGYRKLK